GVARAGARRPAGDGRLGPSPALRAGGPRPPGRWRVRAHGAGVDRALPVPAHGPRGPRTLRTRPRRAVPPGTPLTGTLTRGGGRATLPGALIAAPSARPRTGRPPRAPLDTGVDRRPVAFPSAGGKPGRKRPERRLGFQGRKPV